MHRATTSLIAVAGMTVALIVTGCAGGNSDQSAASSVASAPLTDTAAVYHAYNSSFDVFDCSSSWPDLGDANVAHDFGAMHTHAATYAAELAKWAETIKAIDFPAPADDAAKAALAVNDSEIEHLGAIATVSTVVDANVAFTVVNLDDAKANIELDKIDAALGHPRSAARLALHGLNLARSTALAADAHSVTWDDAVKRDDLPALKALNVAQESGYRDYLAGLGTITFPDGVGPLVNELKHQIEGLLAGDAEQDNATSIPALEAVKMAGTTESIETAYGALSDKLLDMDPKSADPSAPPKPACP